MSGCMGGGRTCLDHMLHAFHLMLHMSSYHVTHLYSSAHNISGKCSPYTCVFLKYIFEDAMDFLFQEHLNLKCVLHSYPRLSF